MKTDYELQAENFLQQTGTTFSAEWDKYGYHFADDKQERHIFKCVFRRGRRSFPLRFGQSIAADTKPPTAYDVLACLRKYDCGSLEDFCSEFGYDDDSRTAERVYKAICKEYENVCRIWSDEEIELMQEIQ